jgi:predicted RNA-binding Zn ribbon-like protein
VAFFGFIGYASVMPNAPRSTTPPPGHENSVAAPAPGDLELVRSFLSLHDHPPGITDDRSPTAPTLDRWLRDHGFAVDGLDEAGAARAARVLEDLRTLVWEGQGAARDEDALARLDRAARDAGVAPSLATGQLVADADGIDGVLGRLLAIAFLARADGSFARLRPCANHECRSVFFDRSKNRSGRWCDMRSCGTQAKVRAYRARQRAAGA